MWITPDERSFKGGGIQRTKPQYIKDQKIMKYTRQFDKRK